jgi:hypothetical protein
MMPSTSKKQHNFMAAVAHNPSFAKKVGVPQSVGKEFNKADKGKTFKQGGDMKKMAMGGSVKPTAMGAVKTAAPSRDGVATKGKTKGTQVKMAGSGVPNGIGSKVMKKGGLAKGMKYGGKC